MKFYVFGYILVQAQKSVKVSHFNQCFLLSLISVNEILKKKLDIPIEKLRFPCRM